MKYYKALILFFFLLFSFESSMARGLLCSKVFILKTSIMDVEKKKFYADLLKEFDITGDIDLWMYRIETALKKGSGLHFLEKALSEHAEKEVYASYARYKETPSDRDLYYEGRDIMAYDRIKLLVSIYLHHNSTHSKLMAEVTLNEIKKYQRDLESLWTSLIKNDVTLNPGEVFALLKSVSPKYKVMGKVVTTNGEFFDTFIKFFKDDVELAHELSKFTETETLNKQNANVLISQLLAAKRYKTIRLWLGAQNKTYTLSGHIAEWIQMSSVEFKKMIRMMNRQGHKMNLNDYKIDETLGEPAVDNLIHLLTTLKKVKFHRKKANYRFIGTVVLRYVFIGKTNLDRARIYRALRDRLEKEGQYKENDLLLLIKEVTERIISQEPRALDFYMFLKNELSTKPNKNHLDKPILKSMIKLKMIYSKDFYRNVLSLVALLNKSDLSLDFAKFNEVRSEIDSSNNYRTKAHQALKDMTDIEIKALAYYLEILTHLQIGGGDVSISFHLRNDDLQYNNSYFRPVRKGFESNSLFFNFYTALRRISLEVPPELINDHRALTFKVPENMDYFSKDHLDALVEARSFSIGFDWLIEVKNIRTKAEALHSASPENFVFIWRRAQSLYNQLLMQTLQSNKTFHHEPDTYRSIITELKVITRILLENVNAVEFSFVLAEGDKKQLIQRIKDLDESLDQFNTH